MLFRSFLQGMVIGHAFPNLFSWIFAGFPWLILGGYALVLYFFGEAMSASGIDTDYRLTVIGVGAAGFLATAALLARMSLVLLRLFLGGVYGLLYGGLAYDISGGGAFWGLLIGGLTAWWMFELADFGSAGPEAH